MSTMELRTSLLKEVAAIIADDDLTAEALKALRRKSRIMRKEQEVKSPCNYETETMTKRAESALVRYKQGEYVSQDDMLKRTGNPKTLEQESKGRLR